MTLRRVMSRLWAPVLVAVAAVGPAARVHAQQPSAPRASARLHYEVLPDVAGCPDEEAVRGVVAARLGYSAFDADNPQFSVRIVIRREPRTLVGELSIARSEQTPSSAPAPRVLRAPEGQCEELLASVAATLAMTLDPSALYGAKPEQPQASIWAAAPMCPAPAPCPICVDPLLRAELASSPKAQTLQLDAAVGGGVTLLGLPAPAPHFQLELGLRIGRFRAAVSGVVTGSADDDAPDAAAGQLTYGTLGVCLEHALEDTFRIGACAIGSAGGLTASQRNPPAQSTRPTGALGGRLQAEWAFVPWVFLRFSVDAQAALTRHLFELEGELRWTSPPMWLGLQLAVGVRLS
jgi:hypothetical protein